MYVTYVPYVYYVVFAFAMEISECSYSRGSVYHYVAFTHVYTWYMFGVIWPCFIWISLYD
jgi:hypothetical protein